MNAGMLEQIGSPEEIYLSPTSLLQPIFVGEPNIMENRRERQGIDTMGWISM